MKNKFLHKLIALPIVCALGVFAFFTGSIATPSTAPTAQASINAWEDMTLSVEERIWAIPSRINLDTDLSGITIGPTTWADLEFDKETEFEVNSVAGLLNLRRLVLNMADFSGKTVYLTANIDYAQGYPDDQEPHLAIGTSINPFNGTFDGGGYWVRVLTIQTTADETATGFFGVLDNATIKNLRLRNYEINPAGDITNDRARNYFGAIAGYATNSLIMNCVNRANITLSTADGVAAGIVAGGENLQIANCVNSGKITAVAGTATGITGTTDSNSEVILCVNFGEIDTVTPFDTTGHEINDWAQGSAWDTESNRTTLLEELNADIYESKYAAKTDPTRDEYRHLLYWGYSEKTHTTITLAFPSSSPNHGIVPILAESLLREYVVKNMGIQMINIYFIDAYIFIDGTDDIVGECRNQLYAKYLELLDRLNDLSIKDLTLEDESDIIVKLPAMMSQFVDTACVELDEIFNTWYDFADEQYVAELFSLAVSVVTAWYEDSYAFIIGEDERAIQSRTALESKYDLLIEELYETEYQNNTELFLKVKTFTTAAIVALDDIYYEWEIEGYLIELEEAYDEIRDLAKSSQKRNKVQKIYATAMQQITEAYSDFEDTNGVRTGTWIEYSSATADAIYTAIAEFETLERKWHDEKNTIIWTSVSGSVVLVAAVVIITLLLVLRNQKKKYNSIIFNTDSKNRKIQQLTDKAEKISQVYQTQRRIADEIARINREKAELLIQLEKEKRDQQKNFDTPEKPE